MIKGPTMQYLVPELIIKQIAAGEHHGAFQAASLFVDLSGFTAMTEQLLQHGVWETETLASLMETIFTPLVEAIATWGGQITRFSGDAFTAIFPLASADVWLHAVSAAQMMQAKFAPLAHQTTPVGSMHFALKIGLGAGQIQWHIVTSPDGQRATYYFSGTAITDCVRAQEQAQPNTIVLSPSVAAKLGPAVSGTTGAKGYLRLDQVNTIATPPPRPAPVASNQALLEPFVGSDVLQLNTRGEFRYVTTVMINLKRASTVELLSEIIQTLFELQNQYGGYLSAINFDDKGCTVLLLWGAPTSTESDATRALRFVEALSDQAPTRLRVGITSQWIYAGLIGSLERSEYSGYGRGLNLAARMMTSAPWDSVWLDEHTAQQIEHQFELLPRGPQLFKGFEQSLEVFELGARRDTFSTLYRGSLISRDAELAQMSAALQPLQSGEFAGAVVIVGEAGLGKSRLVHEYQYKWHAAAGSRWLLAQTDEVLRQSLNPWRYLLRNYFQQIPDADERQNKASFERILNELISTTSDPQLHMELNRTRSFLGALLDLYWPNSLYERIDATLRLPNTIAAVKTLIRTESRRQPLVILLEDAHWLDPDSRLLLHELMRNVELSPFALLITARPSDQLDQLLPPGVRQTHIQLTALSPAATSHVAANLLEGPITAELAEFLAQRAEGNPFFVEQLVLFLREQNLLTSSAPFDLRSLSDTAATLPTNIQNVLVARIDRLSASVKKVVQTAAVLGREWPLRVLLHMLQNDSQLLDKVKVAENAAIWAALSEIRYLFKHALLRDAAYAMQLRSHVRALHALAAQSIEEVYAGDLSGHYSDLVYHSRLAEQAAAERHWAALAGRQAAARYANNEAIQYFSRALELTPPSEVASRVDLLFAREAVFDLLGDRDAQQRDLAAIRTLAEQHKDQLALARVLVRESDCHTRMGNYASTRMLVDQVLESIARTIELPPLILVKSRLLRARVNQHFTDFSAALHDAQVGLELAQRHGLRYDEAELYMVLSTWLRSQGQTASDSAQELEWLNQALTIYHELGDQRGEAEVYLQLGVYYDHAGDYITAREMFEQSRLVFHEIGDIWREAGALNNLGLAHWFLGDYSSALSYYERCLELSYESGRRQGVCITLINLGLLNHVTNQQQTAQQYCQAALAIARDIGDRVMEAYAQTYLGHTFTATERWQAAADAYAVAATIRRQMNHWSLLIETMAGMARLEFAQGRLAPAVEHVNAILELIQQHSLDGAEEPFRIHWTCYEILHASGDQRSPAVLTSAYQQLHKVAEQIADPALRAGFFQNVAAHRLILSAWAQANP